MTTQLFDISGKVAFITGGSRGIGQMIARAYVEAGVRVYICSRKAQVCDAAAAELSAYGECISMPADLSDMTEVERVVTAMASSPRNSHRSRAAWSSSSRFLKCQ